MSWEYYDNGGNNHSSDFSYDSSRYYTENQSIKYDPSSTDYIHAISSEIVPGTSSLIRMVFYNPTYSELGNSYYYVGPYFGGKGSSTLQGGYCGALNRNNTTYTLINGYISSGQLTSTISYALPSPLSESTWYGLELIVNCVKWGSLSNQYIVDVNLYDSDFTTKIGGVGNNTTTQYNDGRVGFLLRNGSTSGYQWIDSFEVYTE